MLILLILYINLFKIILFLRISSFGNLNAGKIRTNFLDIFVSGRITNDLLIE